MEKVLDFNSQIEYNYSINDRKVIMKSWDELSELEQCACIYSDMSKDAYGFRSRLVFDTVEEYKAEFDRFAKIIEENEKERKQAEAEAIVRFEDRVANLMHDGTNRERVIAWLMDAEGADGDEEYMCFLCGLPYGYFRKVA